MCLGLDFSELGFLFLLQFWLGSSLLPEFNFGSFLFWGLELQGKFRFVVLVVVLVVEAIIVSGALCVGLS